MHNSEHSGLEIVSPIDISKHFRVIPDHSGKNEQSRYIVGDQLGQGGFSQVLHVYDQKAAKPYALKVTPQTASKPNLAELEALTHASLDHPHILKFHDFIGNFTTSSGIVDLLFMEYCSGIMLRDYFENAKSKGAPPVLGEIASMTNDIATTLTYLHSHNIVHRDLKPENVMLRKRDQHLFVIDLALASWSPEDQNERGFLTPQYTALELWIDDAIASEQSDSFSLGVMVYEMLTNSWPFGPLPPSNPNREEKIAIFKAIYQEKPKSLFDFPQLIQQIGEPGLDIINTALIQTLSTEPHERLTPELLSQQVNKGLGYNALMLELDSSISSS